MKKARNNAHGARNFFFIVEYGCRFSRTPLNLSILHPKSCHTLKISPLVFHNSVLQTPIPIHSPPLPNPCSCSPPLFHVPETPEPGPDPIVQVTDICLHIMMTVRLILVYVISPAKPASATDNLPLLGPSEAPTVCPRHPRVRWQSHRTLNPAFQTTHRA